MEAALPAVNGAFTARSLAKMYAALANGGSVDGCRLLKPETVYRMGKVQSRRRDKVLLFPMRWRLGYHQAFAFGAKIPKAFGHFGLGGSGGWCDPTRNLAMALTLNTGLGTPAGDMRIGRMGRHVVQCADRRSTLRNELTQVHITH